MISGSGPVNPSNLPPLGSREKGEQKPDIAVKIINETQTSETAKTDLSQKLITCPSNDFDAFIKLFDLSRLKTMMDPDVFICWEAILQPYHSETERENQLKDLEKIFSKDKEAVDFTLQINQEVYITPLIASILNNRPDQLKILLRQGVDVNRHYFGGNTLAHFAAITGNQETIKILKEAGADFNLSNLAGTTATDYLEKQVKAETQVSVHPFKEGREFDQESYTKEFKSKYLEKKLKYEPNELLAIAFEASQWGESLESEDLMDHILRVKFDEFFSQEIHTPKVYLTRLTNKDDGSLVPEVLKNQWEARARQNVEAGELIGEYTGNYLHAQLPKDIKGHDRIMGYGEFRVDATSTGNLLAFINDGFPNCAIDFVVDSKGFPHTVVYALRDIKENEVLYFNYGASFFDVLGIKREVLNPEAMKRYIEEMERSKEEERIVDEQLGVSEKNAIKEILDETRSFKIEAYLNSLVGKSSDDNLSIGDVEEIKKTYLS